MTSLHHVKINEDTDICLFSWGFFFSSLGLWMKEKELKITLTERSSPENQIGTIWTAELFLYKPNVLVVFQSTLLQHYFHSSPPNLFWDCASDMLIHPQPVVLTYALFGSGAFLSDTFSVGLVGVVGPVEPVVLAVLALFVIPVGPEGLVGVVALNLFTDGVGVFCTNCFSFALFSSSAAFLKKAMRSLTEPMPPPNGSDGGLPPGRPNLGPWKRHSKTTKPMRN